MPDSNQACTIQPTSALRAGWLANSGMLHDGIIKGADGVRNEHKKEIPTEFKYRGQITPDSPCNFMIIIRK